MFYNSSFDPKISHWAISKNTKFQDLFDSTSLKAIKMPTVFHWQALFEQRIDIEDLDLQALAHYEKYGIPIVLLNTNYTSAAFQLHDIWINPNTLGPGTSMELPIDVDLL